METGAQNITDTVDVGPPTCAVAASGIRKHYRGIEALRGVSLELWNGQITGLVGDNGAGKSTLTRIMAGAEQASEGTLWVAGHQATMKNTVDARTNGIETVYQDLALAPHLNVVQNIFLGSELAQRGIGRWIGWLDEPRMRQECLSLLDDVGVTIPDPGMPCRMLSGGQRQAVALARLLYWKPRAALLDEPTAALGPEQQERVAGLMKRLRDGGTAILLISHNLLQILNITDSVYVMRTGRIVAQINPKETTAEELIAYITGAKRGSGE